LKIVLDSNILFSALIKDSVTRRIILEYNGLFLFPSYIFEEMNKHKEELLKKSGLEPAAFHQLLGLVLQKVVIVPTETLLRYRTEAYDLVKDIDPDDTLFIACALAYSGSVIWSEDKELKKQGRIHIITTTEMFSILYPEHEGK
jgi:predicted nucleic acid-binding protein